MDTRNPPNFLPALEAAIDIRYRPALYHLHGATRERIWRFRLLRFTSSLGQWSIGLAKSIFWRPPKQAYLGIYSTRNQRLALERLRDQVDSSLSIHSIYEISPVLALRMVGLILLSMFFYSVRVWKAVDYFSIHDKVLLRPRVLAISSTIKELQPTGLAVSNDHQGEIFWMAYALSLEGHDITYVQHGMVKEQLPPNYFKTCYVRDKVSRDIYMNKLCRREDVSIQILPQEASPEDLGGPSVKPVLIALSHQFHLKETRKLIRILKSAYGKDLMVQIRFHPSDRFAGLKFLLCRLGNTAVAQDRADNPFSQSFRASSLTICASSSILVEAAQMDPERVVWLKSLGLTWDYYSLSGTIPIYEHVDDLKRSVRNLIPA